MAREHRGEALELDQVEADAEDAGRRRSRRRRFRSRGASRRRARKQTVSGGNERGGVVRRLEGADGGHSGGAGGGDLGEPLEGDAAEREHRQRRATTPRASSSSPTGA